MGKKLYVGNIPFTAKENDLTSFFSRAGAVQSASIITDRESGRSKGFGFVEMSSDQEAETAINTLNGADFQGRAITVAEARPQPPRDEGRGGGGFGRGRR